MTHCWSKFNDWSVFNNFFYQNFMLKPLLTHGQFSTG